MADAPYTRSLARLLQFPQGTSILWAFSPHFMPTSPPLRISLLLLLTSVIAPAQTSPSLTRGPYLQLATPDSIHILWRQRSEAQPSVHWGTASDQLNSQVTAANGISLRKLASEGASSPGTQPLHSAPEETCQYEAHLTGLQPATTYHYAVYDGPIRLTPADGSYTFKTLPVPGSDAPAWVWVAGDGGTGGTIQGAVHQAMLNYTRIHNISLDLFLHVGDMAYQSGLDSELQGRFFEMYGPTLRQTVCWPAMGNHEGLTSKGLDGVGPYYDSFLLPTKGEAGGVASGREAYYSYDFGKIHFIVLDSCQESVSKNHVFTPLGEAMLEWLKADLEKATADWLIAYWHHPPYTKGSHDSDTPGDYESIIMRETFVPLLESAGVDLILNGHSHIYERSMLIDGAYATPSVAQDVVLDDGDGNPQGDGAYTKSAGLKPHEGFVAVVTGNAGTGLKRIGTIPFMKSILLEHGSFLFKIQGDTLQAIMLNREGKQSDTFTLQKRGLVAPRTKLAQPKPAPPMTQPDFVKADGGDGSADNVTSKDPAAQPAGSPPPAEFTDLIPRGSEWHYQINGVTEGWAKPDYDDATWSVGKAGFGYGDDDDATVLDLRGDKQFRIRHLFTLTGKEDLTKLGLFVSYDDGFIAYINGMEVARSPNMKGSGADAKITGPHEADGKFLYWSLASAAPQLHPGTHVLAIRGWNDDPKSSDFTLHPQLILAK